MSHTLTQPEELDLALLEEDFSNSPIAIEQERPMTDFLRKGYVSPYRAAYLNSRQAERSLYLQNARG